jgi:hypothetical protein
VDPLESATPFTVNVAVGSIVVGFTVTEDIVLLTLAVYPVVPLAKTGLKLPPLKMRPDRFALEDGARITVTV